MKKSPELKKIITTLREQLDQQRAMSLELEDVITDLENGSALKEPVRSTRKPKSTKRKLKLGIVVGHTAEKPGAHGQGIRPEYHYNSEIAARIERNYRNHTMVSVKVFKRDNGGIAGAYARADKWGADATIELHYNSASNKSARGAETLYLAGSHDGAALADKVQTQVAKVMGKERQQRLLPRKRGERGSYSLRAGNAPAIIVEPGFGSNQYDAKLLRDRKDTLARAYVTGALDWWRGQ